MNYPDRSTVTLDTNEPAHGDPYRAELGASTTDGQLRFVFHGALVCLHALNAYAQRMLPDQGARDLALIELGTEPLPEEFRVRVDARLDHSAAGTGTQVDVTVFTSRHVGPGYCAAVVERFLDSLDTATTTW